MMTLDSRVTDENINSHFASLSEEVSELKKRVTYNESLLQKSVDQNKEIIANTAELLQVFTAFKGAWTVLEGVGKLAKPVSYIVGLAVACSGLWFTIKSALK